jgi:hypothetical protein
MQRQAFRMGFSNCTMVAKIATSSEHMKTRTRKSAPYFAAMLNSGVASRRGLSLGGCSLINERLVEVAKAFTAAAGGGQR